MACLTRCPVPDRADALARQSLAALPDLAPGARALTHGYDTGERYLSVEGVFDAPDIGAPAVKV